MVKVFLALGVLLNMPAVLSCAIAEAPTPLSMNRAHSESSGGSEASGDERMIAYAASLRLSVRNAEETRSVLMEQIKGNDGFVVRETENSVTARIPSGNRDRFLTHARTLGTLEGESGTGTDITDQYRDNGIRLDNLRNVRNRYLALLEQARTVADVLGIERELERVNTEIELIEGRMRHAELSVAYSSITVTFGERVRPGPVGWIFYGLYRGIKWLFVWN